MAIKINFDEIENPFLYVVVSAKRAEQLQKGAQPRVTIKSKKSTTIAMQEVLKGRVKYFRNEEKSQNEESSSEE